MKKLVFVLMGVLAVAALLTAFDGDDYYNGHHPRKEGMKRDHMEMMEKHHEGYDMMCEELELTDKQKDEIEAFQIENQKEMVDLQADLKKLVIDQKAAHRDHDFAKIRSLTKKIFQLKEDLALQRIELKEKRWNILTEEQKEKAEELMKDRKFHSEQMIEKWKK